MARIMALGLGPLFEHGVEHVHVGGLRTWSFVEPLLAEGHDVHLFAMPGRPSDKPGPAARETIRTERTPVGKWTYESYTRLDEGYILRDLVRQADAIEPEAIVAVSDLPASLGARLPLDVPFWADLGVFAMVESQAQSAVSGDDEPIAQAWHRVAPILRRADRFSTVTRAHLHAVLGQMALLGRLNRHTFDHHFGHHIPHACHPLFLDLPDLSGDPVLRGKAIPEDAFVVLWSGVYTLSTDARVLFDFIEGLLDAAPQVHFVSTGGESRTAPAPTYAQFHQLIEQSAHRERYHLLGWVPSEQLPRIYQESDIGITVDDANYETFFGARARLCNMMAAGVPPVVTYGTEISRMIEDARCGLVCAPSNAAEMVKTVLDMVRAPEQWEKLSKRARAYAEKEFDARRLAEPLLAWARAPERAPDNDERRTLSRRPGGAGGLTQRPINSLDRRGVAVERGDLADLHRARIELDAIHRRWWYRMVRTTVSVATRAESGHRWVRERLAKRGETEEGGKDDE